MINNVEAIVLAAGKSRRFNTGKTKILSTICGQPMILYPIKVLKSLNIPTTIILNKEGENVRKKIEAWGFNDLNFVTQSEPLGTANAVTCTKEIWNKENILILNGDVPLITPKLIESLCKKHAEENSTLSFFTSFVLDARGYGRIIDLDGKISILEDQECTDTAQITNCINAGIYLVKQNFLETEINNIQKNKTTGEYHFPDIIQKASEQNASIKTISVPYDNVRGVNTLKDLWIVEQIKRAELIDYWMNQGVRFELAQNIHLDLDVKIGRGTFIGTGVHLNKKTIIGENCSINAFSILENTTIGNNTIVHSHSVIQDSKIGNNIHLGPLARLRGNVILNDNSVIGNFVELKNTVIGEGTKAKHLTYLGDATVGSKVNIGAGTITCNHDGVNKHKTIIQDNAYIGSNNTLIAPITVSKDAYTAAGSIINNHVAQGDLAIARAKQINKEGYAYKLREQKKTVKNQFTGAVKIEKAETKNTA